MVQLGPLHLQNEFKWVYHYIVELRDDSIGFIENKTEEHRQTLHGEVKRSLEINTVTFKIRTIRNAKGNKKASVKTLLYMA